MSTVGRICKCGCQRSIDHRREHARYHEVCAAKRHAERMRGYRVGRAEYPHQGPERKAPYPRIDVHKAFAGDLPNRRQKLCAGCGGMPWARTTTRFTADHDPVGNEHGYCNTCHEPYSPEPRPETIPVLGSSAGMAVRANDVHGTEVVRGQNYKKIGRTALKPTG